MTRFKPITGAAFAAVALLFSTVTIGATVAPALPAPALVA